MIRNVFLVAGAALALCIAATTACSPEQVIDQPGGGTTTASSSTGGSGQGGTTTVSSSAGGTGQGGTTTVGVGGNGQGGSSTGAGGAPGCEGGFGDCDQDATNACETDLTSSPSHCGACNNACAAGLSCGLGTCQPPATAVALALGHNHSCALLSDGAIKCWGDNFQGQLGLGDNAPRGDDPDEMGDKLPVVVLGTGKTAKAIAEGEHHTCALLSDDTVKCWGRNDYGQLGLGDSDNRGDNAGEMGDSLPVVDLGAGKTAKALAAGQRHTCALLSDEKVKCWGWNSQGQLGLGDTTHRGDGPDEMGDKLPSVNLGTGKKVKALAAGELHNCAVFSDDTVKCWGRNLTGELGLGDNAIRGDGPNEMGDKLLSVNLGPGKTAKSVVAGRLHNCALLSDDTVKCWGDNYSGELGLGDNASRGDNVNEMGDKLPLVNLGTAKTAKAVAAGDSYSCAVLSDDTVKCWGDNLYGHLGLGDTADRGDGANEMGDTLPVLNLGVGKMPKGLAAGEDHTCALFDGAAVKCWGRNMNGQLGLGDSDNRGDSPDEMGDLLPVVKITGS